MLFMKARQSVCGRPSPLTLALSPARCTSSLSTGWGEGLRVRGILSMKYSGYARSGAFLPQVGERWLRRRILLEQEGKVGAQCAQGKGRFRIDREQTHARARPNATSHRCPRSVPKILSRLQRGEDRLVATGVPDELH